MTNEWIKPIELSEKDKQFLKYLEDAEKLREEFLFKAFMIPKKYFGVNPNATPPKF